MNVASLSKKMAIELQEAYDIINKSNLVIFKWTLSEEIPTDFVSENISLFGYKPEDFYYGQLQDYWEFVHPEDRERVKRELYEARDNGKLNYKNQYRVVCKDNSVRWVEEWVVHERDSSGKLIQEKGIITDITEKKLAEEKVRYLSEHDALTGLHNRLFFDEKIVELERGDVQGVCIIIGDVNGLKMVNDAFGHKMGDAMLKAVSNVFVTIFTKQDEVVARLSGDEFAIITHRRNIPELIEAIHKACKDLVQFPFVVDISMGYAVRKRYSQSMDSVFREADYQMYRNKLRRSKKIKLSMIQALQKQLEAKSIETVQHSERMVEYAVKLGKELKMSDANLEELALAVSMHDIGMVSIDSMVLDKRGPLTLDERKEVMKHCEIGYHLLVATPSLAGIGEYVLAHHENFDGSGYPQGLIGYDIPLISRIISVVDSFEAMTNNRPYRSAKTEEEAIEELLMLSGKKYDPNIVIAFVNSINEAH